MSKTKLFIDTAVEVADALIGSETIRTFFCGKYSDGTPRSLPDALNDELYSPEQKRNKEKNEKKKNKKKKKKKGNKKKKKSSSVEDLYFKL
jgi:hypothetical protein